jgi:hypothetical protein
MPTFEELLQMARRLPPAQQRELVRALTQSRASGDLPMAAPPGAPAPHSVAWVKAERGHAVLATDTAPSETALPPGAAALAGIGADRPELRAGGREEGP